MAELGPDTSSPGKQPPFWRTAWPDMAPTDGDSLRRRKLAVRAGHLAMVCMVFVAAGGALLLSPQPSTALQLAGLAVAATLYVLWNIVGTQGVVRLILWEQSEAPLTSLRNPPCGVPVFFIAQLALATALYLGSDRGQMPNPAWLALLPPVAYAVFILEWPGITTVSALMLAVLVGNFHHWHGATFALYGGLAFSFAILFTLVFSVLAVQAEKARGDVQRLAAELRAANARLREQAMQAEELSATRERNRIAREIHDSLGHFLTVANMQVEAARALARKDPARADEAAAKAQAFIQEGLRDIRQSVASLRNSPLDNKPLAQALQELARANPAETPAVELIIVGTLRQLPSPVELSLYRAAQEGLTNARRHARATHVRLRLDFATPKAVALSVQDDGVGTSRAPEVGGFGLRGLRERAQLLGGSVTIETAPNAGFTVKFEVPA